MASLKISEVLNRLGMKSLRELSRKRDLEGRRETSESLASRLAKSYKGDFNALLKDLTRHDFMRIFAQPLRIGKIQCELRNKSQHNLPDFQRFAHQVFVDGIVAQEFNVLDEPLVKSPKELEAILREDGNLLKNEDLSYRDLSGFNFSGCNLIGVKFNHSNLRGANFNGATLSDVKMIAADLQGSSWKGAVLIDVPLDNGSSVFYAIGDRNAVEGIQVKFGPNNWYEDYSNLNLRGSVILGHLIDPDFQGSDLTNAKIAIDYYGDINFDKAKFENTEIVKLDGDGEGKSSFVGATFDSVKFVGNFDFFDANFTNASFVGIDFSGLRFWDCIFDGVKFEGCNIEDVAFIKCSFSRSDFDDCFYNQASFENCNIRDSNLYDCDIKATGSQTYVVIQSDCIDTNTDDTVNDEPSWSEECDSTEAQITPSDNKETL